MTYEVEAHMEMPGRVSFYSEIGFDWLLPPTTFLFPSTYQKRSESGILGVCQQLIWEQKKVRLPWASIRPTVVLN